MTDFGNSIKSILNERISSPFYGSFIVSWLLWNWEITYVTFFIDASKLTVNKIEYILQNCGDVNHLVVYPFISTIAILTVFPFLSNGAYWVTLKFDSWRIRQKNKIENKQLLTLEQSVQLRLAIQISEEKNAKLISSLNGEIDLLTKQLEFAINEKNKEDKTDDNKANNANGNEKDVVKSEYGNLNKIDDADLKAFLKNSDVANNFDKLIYLVQSDQHLSSVPDKLINYLALNDLIVKALNGWFAITDKGKSYFKEYLRLNSN